MQLVKRGTTILTPTGTVVARIDPRRAEAVLIAQGCRPAVAREVSYGELSSDAARRLGRVAGLLV